MKQAKDPYAALRYPDFRYFITAQFLFTIAILIQEIVISYYLYDKTNDPLTLGLIGLFEAIPYISLALFGGYFADRKDKRTIIQVCYIIIMMCSLLLLWVTHPSAEHGFDLTQQKNFIYLVVFFLGVARGFYGPAWTSLKPFLVAAEHYSNSASWSSQFWQTGSILGPALGGFFYAWLGLTDTLILVIVFFLIAFVFVSRISKKGIQNIEKQGSVVQSLKEGISFVVRNKILFYAILLDMFSVLFGGVVAILPVFAKDILHVGPEGLGIMRAAPGVGAVLTMLGTAYFPPTHKAWRNMLIAVTGFGLATLIFAFSTSFLLSIGALFLTGAFDSISVVIRQTILQVLPPDDMRGRVSSVNGIFVSCSNELGAFESGALTKLIGPIQTVVFGGVMTLVIAATLFVRSKELFAFKLERTPNQ